jgi:phage terminase small subunit
MRQPQGLSKEAKDFWQQNAPEMLQDGRLTEGTRNAFLMLCNLWARLTQGERDNLDAIKIVALSKQVQQLMKAFGMTPESRKRLKLDKDNEPQDIGQAIRKAMGQ